MGHVKQYKAVTLSMTAFLLSWCIASYADPAIIPPSLDPSRIEQSLEKPLKPKPQIQDEISVRKMRGSNIPNAKEIKFKLEHIIIVGNSVYSSKELISLFDRPLGTEVSLKDVENYAAQITKFYGNHGYILSKAILPAQVIKNGTVKVQVIEGHVSNVAVKFDDSDEKSLRPLLMGIAKYIFVSRPLNNSVLERYTLLANDIPGVTVRTILKADKKHPEGSTMTFVVTRKLNNIYASWDNRGTIAVGPRRYTIDVSRNNLARAAGQTGVRGSTTSKGKELQFWQVYHDEILDADGLRMTLSYSGTYTFPEPELPSIQIKGVNRNALITLVYPAIRSRSKNLFFNASLSYINTDVDVTTELAPNGERLYTDSIRVLGLAANYQFQDSWRGFNDVNFAIHHGLNISGASHRGEGSLLSRDDGQITFYRFNLDAIRTQWITQHNSMVFSLSAQGSPNTLLVSQEFGFGGEIFGQAYDTSEIIGDNGIATKAEWRYSKDIGLKQISWIQLFGFYELGKIWNHDTTEVEHMESATDLGFGFRASLYKHYSFSLTWAKPLTVDVNALKHRKPRVFFSLSMSL